VCTSGTVDAGVASFAFTNPIGKAHAIAIAVAGAGTFTAIMPMKSKKAVASSVNTISIEIT
jgi:hypothetical protein